MGRWGGVGGKTQKAKIEPGAQETVYNNMLQFDDVCDDEPCLIHGTRLCA